MRTGEPTRQCGFGYMGMLFFVAITAAALAALGQQWQTAMQRERERELEFRGGEIARAIDSYLRAAPANPPPYPRSLDDLLVDARGPTVRHHLRRRYADPFTGQPDWLLIPAPGQPQAFAGVRSRSEQALLRERGGDAATRLLQASDWQFMASPQGQLAQPTAPGASGVLNPP